MLSLATSAIMPPAPPLAWVPPAPPLAWSASCLAAPRGSPARDLVQDTQDVGPAVDEVTHQGEQSRSPAAGHQEAELGVELIRAAVDVPDEDGAPGHVVPPPGPGEGGHFGGTPVP